MRTPEFFEKQEIKKYLEKIGAWHFSPYMAGMGKAGIADIIACVPLLIPEKMVGMRVGIFTSLEVKRDGKLPTPLQEHRMDEILACGGFATWGTAGRVINQLKRLPYVEPKSD